MKSTAKYVEIMEKLTGISVGSQVTFDENTYELTAINTDELDAAVTLTAEGQEDIVMSLKELIESEEHVVEKKACKENDDEEEDGDDDEASPKKKDDDEDEEEMKEMSDEDYDKMSDEEKAAYDKKMKKTDEGELPPALKAAIAGCL
jgi:hypothetical protein